MIVFENVTKQYSLKRGRTTILDDATFAFPRGKSMAILGINGAGKSTMIRMIAGTEPPDRGRIRRNGLRVSWPLGFSGGFHGSLSGRQNIRFASRIYDSDPRQVEAFVEDFSELGKHLDAPVRTYSSGMRARLAFGLSMAIDFDVYLVDEITAVGDARFKSKCQNAFADRHDVSDVLMVSHSADTVKKYCDSGCILHDGEMQFFETLEEAVDVYNALLKSLQ
ncbi:MAG TPA: ABC transporter ATP-binding protein [Hyphomicrobiales bacterium]|nr:ABC transporter ATP-binding protein [Kaistiaceae bacterium]HQF30220.1 ABC transporter ATP-binding protein [Hyphomicrobiales bacterium]